MVRAVDLIAQAEARGARFSVVGDKLCAVPATSIAPDLFEAIGAHKAEVIEELCRRQEQAAALIGEARAAGLVLTVKDADGLLVRHPTDPNPDEDLLQRLAANKAAVIAELQRQADVLVYAMERLTLVDDGIIPDAPKDRPGTAQVKLTRDGVLCAACRRIGVAYEVAAGRYVCPVCVEWRIAGCLQFTVVQGADEVEAAKTGCCLACGSSIELHGRPDPASWRRVDSLDDVHLAEVRFVLARAREIARGSS